MKTNRRDQKHDLCSEDNYVVWVGRKENKQEVRLKVEQTFKKGHIGEKRQPNKQKKSSLKGVIISKSIQACHSLHDSLS